MHGLVIAAKMAGVGVAAESGDFVQREVGVAHQFMGLFQPDPAEQFLGAGLAHLGKKPPQVAGRHMDDIRHVFDGRVAGKMLGKPRESTFDAKTGDIGERHRFGRATLAVEQQKGKIHEPALKMERTGDDGMTEMLLEMAGDVFQPEDVGLAQRAGQPASALAHNLIQRMGYTAKMKGEPVVGVMPIIDPAMGKLRGENPEGVFMQVRTHPVFYNQPASAINYGIKLPIGARVAAHA